MTQTSAIAKTVYQARRQIIAEQLPDNSAAVVFSGSEVTRSNDTEYLFCPAKSFYYLTGFKEADAICIIEKNNSKVTSTLFCLPKDALQEVWHGRRVGAESAASAFGFDHSYSLNEVDDRLPILVENKEHLFFDHSESKHHRDNIEKWLKVVRKQERQGISCPKNLSDLKPFINEARLKKSAEEISLMKVASGISSAAHKKAMATTKPGAYEYQVEAELLYVMAKQGARVAAYNSIVAGGDNANILHYTENCDQLLDGELLLIDAGGEYQGYAADITRTFPINGKFSVEQKALYELVLKAQESCIEAIAPGKSLGELNVICERIFTEGLHQLGLLTGELSELIEQRTCKKYFIHGLGHWLGLDVHDVGDYKMKDGRQTRAFEPGMVMTIEPGLYIPSDDLSVDEKWRGIAIRIEDNILVTESGYENLTTVVKSVEEIEQLVGTDC